MCSSDPRFYNAPYLACAGDQRILLNGKSLIQYEKEKYNASINKYRTLVTCFSVNETINYARSAKKAYQDGNTKECLIDVGTMAALVDCTARNLTGSKIEKAPEMSLYGMAMGYATYQQLAQAYAAYKNNDMRDATKHAGIAVGLGVAAVLPILGTDYFIGKK